MTKRVLIAGLVASIAMAMIEMMYEGLFGAGLWAAPVFIAATVLRDLQTIAVPVVFSAVPVIVGIMGHMMNSIVLGFVFVMLLGRYLRSPLQGSVIGIAYALAVFFAMWLVVLPAIDPVMLKLNPYVFAISHIAWGAALGAIAAKRMRTAVQLAAMPLQSLTSKS